MIRNNASQRGVRVSITDTEDGVIITVSKVKKFNLEDRERENNEAPHTDTAPQPS